MAVSPGTTVVELIGRAFPECLSGYRDLQHLDDDFYGPHVRLLRSDSNAKGVHSSDEGANVRPREDEATVRRSGRTCSKRGREDRDLREDRVLRTAPRPP
jgi:hypothetical protein